MKIILDYLGLSVTTRVLIRGGGKRVRERGITIETGATETA